MKVCIKCGASLNDNEKFCSSCGAKQPDNVNNYNYYQNAPANRTVETSGMAIAGLVLGIVGIIISWFTFYIPSILGLIFSIIGMLQCKNGQKNGHGMAVAGLVLSIIALAIMVIVLIAALAAGSYVMSFGRRFLY